jgi:hypothetical protein
LLKGPLQAFFSGFLACREVRLQQSIIPLEELSESPDVDLSRLTDGFSIFNCAGPSARGVSVEPPTCESSKRNSTPGFRFCADTWDFTDKPRWAICYS